MHRHAIQSIQRYFASGNVNHLANIAASPQAAQMLI
jgi:hypothetical protein